jgi:hypothetical protein
MKTYHFENCFEHLARQLEENRIYVNQQKRPSGRGMGREETCTFVYCQSLVVSISSIEIVGAKKNLNLVPSVT